MKNPFPEKNLNRISYTQAKKRNKKAPVSLRVLPNRQRSILPGRLLCISDSHSAKALVLCLSNQVLSTCECLTTTMYRRFTSFCASLRSFKSCSLPMCSEWEQGSKQQKKHPYHYECFLTSSYLSSQAVSNQVLSACKCLTTVFGMGTGGTT